MSSFGYVCSILTKLEIFCRHGSVKVYASTNYMNIRQVRAELVHEGGQTDRQI